MDVIIDVFHQYSRREGDRDTLTKKELKLLIEKQLANYLKVSGDSRDSRGEGSGLDPIAQTPQGPDSAPSRSSFLPQHHRPAPPCPTAPFQTYSITTDEGNPLGSG